MASSNNTDNPNPSSPWYKDGLRFSCTGCGKCCTGSPGYVWITVQEIVQIAQFLQLSIEEFASQYIRQCGSRYSLTEMNNGDCVFLINRRCAIYEVRPTQCQTYPWWPQNLESPESWKLVQKECEGVSNKAPIVDLPTIEKELDKIKRS